MTRADETPVDDENTADKDQLHIDSSGSSSATPTVQIPEARDGFFGYNEEKSLLHQARLHDAQHIMSIAGLPVPGQLNLALVHVLF